MTNRGTPWPGASEPTSTVRRRRILLGALVVVVAAATAGTMLALPDTSIEDPATVADPAGSASAPSETAEPSDEANSSSAPSVPAASVPAAGGWEPDTLYVALYGHPGSSTLGVLGEQDVDAAVVRAQEVAAPYAEFGRPVVPTFEIITTVASFEAGPDDDYSNEFPDSKFQPWIDAALENDMHVILDLQSGRATFPSQAREIEALLVHPHVSLALDPEWRVGPTDRPEGGRIGSVDGAEVNETIAYLDELIQRFELPPKMLVVHQFTPSMVTNKGIIRGTDNVHVVFQMDGFGTLPLKISSWDVMVADLPPGASTGWKNFYDEDNPTPTAAESLAVEPTPIYISYQ